jgi:hypothetical protein
MSRQPGSEDLFLHVRLRRTESLGSPDCLVTKLQAEIAPPGRVRTKGDPQRHRVAQE